MKVRITYRPEESEKAESVAQDVQKHFRRVRRHETEKEGMRMLYLTERDPPKSDCRKPGNMVY